MCTKPNNLYEKQGLMKQNLFLNLAERLENSGNSTFLFQKYNLYFNVKEIYPLSSPGDHINRHVAL